VAQTEGNFTGFGNGPSVNDSGDVAFVGNTPAGEAVFFWNGSGGSAPRSISGGINQNKAFGSSVWVNNNDVVAARRLLRHTVTNSHAMRLYDGNSQCLDQDNCVTVATGGHGTLDSHPDDYDEIFFFPSINNQILVTEDPTGVFSAGGTENGNIVFSVRPEGSSYVALETPPISAIGDAPIGPGPVPQPAIADDGRVAAKVGADSDDPIFMWGAQLSGPPELIAKASQFSDIGRSPGITDNGQVVTFYGELSQAGADALNTAQPESNQLDPGPGIFVSVAVTSGERIVQRVAGIDSSGSIASFDKNSRVAVAYDGGSFSDGLIAVYLATSTGGKQGVYVNHVDVANIAAPSFSAPSVVLEAGDIVDGIAATVESVSVYDPVNNAGHIALWAGFSDGSSAILRAGEPPSTQFLEFTHLAVDAPHKLQLSYRLAQELQQPLNVQFFVSEDTSLDVSVDEIIGYNIDLSEQTISASNGALSLLNEQPHSALTEGQHTLVVDLISAGGGALADRLEDPDSELILVGSPDVTKSALEFRGVYQRSPDGRAVFRAGAQTSDAVTLDTTASSLQVTSPSQPISSLRDFQFDIRSAPDVLVVTSDGNDAIVVSGNEDIPIIVQAGAGHDRVIGGVAPDVIDGGDGHDILLGGGIAFTLPDVAVDAFWNDLKNFKFQIAAGTMSFRESGSDTIRGGSGFDVIFGGDGSDTLAGGPGGSLIFGDAFTLSPQFTFVDFSEFVNTPSLETASRSAANLLQFSTGTTLVGEGNDTIIGGDGADLIIGGAGNDDISSGGGVIDIIFGNDGEDTIDASASVFAVVFGGNHRDTLRGGTAGSVLFGGDGPDKLFGGIGDDILIGDGFDFGIVDLSTLLSGLVNFKIPLIELRPRGTGIDELYGDDGFDVLVGGGDDDTLHGGDGGGVLFGDAFRFTAGVDPSKFFSLSAGRTSNIQDVIRASVAFVTVGFQLEGDGIDTIHGGDGVDLIFGGDNRPDPHRKETIDSGSGFADVIFGNKGDDVITSFATFSMIVGGEGNDKLAARGPGGSVILGDGFAFQAGLTFDIDFASVIEGRPTRVSRIDIGAGLNSRGAGTDEIETEEGVNFIIAGDGDDTISASGMFNFILGDSVNVGTGLSVDFVGVYDSTKTPDEKVAAILDRVQLPGLAGAGGDTIDASASLANVIFCGGGVDTVNRRTDKTHGGKLDVIFGNDGDDQISGGDWVNILVGGEGNDNLRGGDFVNLILGDTFDIALPGIIDIEAIKKGRFHNGSGWFAAGNGTDTLTGGKGVDFLIGGDGRDILAGGDGFNVGFGDSFNVDTADISFFDLFSIKNFFAVVADPNGILNLLEALGFTLVGDGQDDYTGGSGTDVVFGGGGNDVLRGKAGFDFLVGGEGNDTVDGGPGLDVVLGGLGDDQLYGGDGDDRLESEEGEDVFHGGRGNDRIFGGADRDTLFGDEGDDELYGEAGDDQLDGGPGNDLLAGGEGDDTLDGNAGEDLLDGGIGNDVLTNGTEGVVALPETPTATDDSAVTSMTVPTIIGILENDHAVSGDLDPSSVRLVLAPNNATVDIDVATGEVTYTPDGGFAGSNFFLYTVSDNAGRMSNIATVIVKVASAPGNVAPVARDDSIYTSQGHLVNHLVLSNDSDPDGHLVVSTLTIATPPEHGQITGVNTTTGVIEYTPNPDFIGGDSFEYTVDDNVGAESNVATVTISVIAPNSLLGDMNGDGNLNNLDIEPFMLAVEYPSLFRLDYPNVEPNTVGDIDGDGVCNDDDIEPFAELLMSRYRPDAREPNNILDIVTGLGTLNVHTEESLTIHGITDEDYFQFRAADSVPARIEIRFDHSQGDLDLFVYDFTQSLIASGESTDDNELILLSFEAGQTYYVQVVGKAEETSPDYTLVIADTEAPTIVNIDPPDGATRGQNFRTVVVHFSEKMDSNTVNDTNFRLAHADGQHVPVTVHLINDGRAVELEFDALDSGLYNVIIEASAVTDLGGTPLGDTSITSSVDVLGATIHWISSQGGSWHEPTNWSGERLPGPTDNVVIDVIHDVVITHNGTTTINSLYSAEEFRLHGGQFEVEEFVQVDNVFTIGGGIELLGATILPGEEGQGLSMVSSIATLAGVILDADMLVEHQARLTIRDSLKINGHVTVQSRREDSMFEEYGDTVVSVSGGATLGGEGEIEFWSLGRSEVYLTHDTGGVLTIDAGLTIRPTSIKGDLPLVNLGLIEGGNVTASSFDNGGTLRNVSIHGTSMNNVGLIEARNGGHCTVNFASWSSSGSIRAHEEAVLSLYGTYRLNNTSLDGRQGRILSYGVLDNRDNTLGFTGELTLRNGTIVGGVLQGDADSAVIVAHGADGTLDGVTLNAGLRVDGQTLVIRNGLVLNGTARLNQYWQFGKARLEFSEGGELEGNGRVVFGGSNGYVGPVGTGGALHIGTGITIEGQNGTIGDANKPLFNEGTIRAIHVSSESSFTIEASSFTNDGTVEAIGRHGSYPAAISLNSQETLNRGLMAARDGGRLNLYNLLEMEGGARLDNEGGSIFLLGTVDNAEHTLPFSGELTLQTGTIIGGVLQGDPDSAVIVPHGTTGTLDGVTLNADLTVDGQTLVIRNGLVLNGTARLNQYWQFGKARLEFSEGGELEGNGRVVFGGSNGYVGPVGTGGALHIGTGITIEGQNGTIGDANKPLFNEGTIRAIHVSSESSFTIEASSFTNDGTVEAIGRHEQYSAQIYVNAQETLNRGLMAARDGGVLDIKRLGNLADGRLDGGSYYVGIDSVLRIPGADISINTAEIVLDGVNSRIVNQHNIDALSDVILNATEGSLSVVNGRTLNLSGSLRNEGLLTIGRESTLFVAEDIEQASSGTVAITLAEDGKFGRIQADGVATLSGSLRLGTADDLILTHDTEFLIGHFGTLEGEFETISGQDAISGWYLEPIYGPDSLSLLAQDLRTLGDVNGDGHVNGLDVEPFVDALLDGSFNRAADVNADGLVNGLDVDPFVVLVLGGNTSTGEEHAGGGVNALGVDASVDEWLNSLQDIAADMNQEGTVTGLESDLFTAAVDGTGIFARSERRGQSLNESVPRLGGPDITVVPVSTLSSDQGRADLKINVHHECAVAGEPCDLRLARGDRTLAQMHQTPDHYDWHNGDNTPDLIHQGTVARLVERPFLIGRRFGGSDRQMVPIEMLNDLQHGTTDSCLSAVDRALEDDTDWIS
jgi:Ca2+-binding RTX toxin-like protein